MLATRLNVNASNRGDSLTVYASAEDLYAGMLHLPGLSLTGGAKQGRMQVSAGFKDTLRKVSGLLGVQAHVVDEHGPNGRVVDLRILPSHVTRGSKTWQIYARKIQLDTAQVVRVVPGTPFGLEVKEEYADQAVRTLRRTGHMKAWRRERLPRRLSLIPI